MQGRRSGYRLKSLATENFTQERKKSYSKNICIAICIGMGINHNFITRLNPVLLNKSSHIKEEMKSKTFQTSSTPTRTSRPKSDAETRSRSSPLPDQNTDTLRHAFQCWRESNGFTLGHRGHSSHQQGWRFCGSFKELRSGTSTLK